MRRKSERNKTKGSPEKKIEKPTRKSARRRGKRATSSSPERDDSQEDTTSDASLSRESNKESTRVQVKELRSATEKIEVTINPDVENKDSSPETEDNGSVWKVARADASPGTIQKLKLCRQRNISETSDHSSSRKRSHKWQGSGEGAVEEVDSNDERLNSPQVEFIEKRPDDASSLSLGQDSNQEVSDYKETLPESTSANLSDDKPNIDLQGDTNEASCFILNTDITTQPIGIAQHMTYEDVVVQAVSDLQEVAEEKEVEENQQPIIFNTEFNQETQQQIVLNQEFVVQEVQLELVDNTSLNLGKIMEQDISQEVQTTYVQVPSEAISETQEQTSRDDSNPEVSPNEKSLPDEIVEESQQEAIVEAIQEGREQEREQGREQEMEQKEVGQEQAEHEPDERESDEQEQVQQEQTLEEQAQQEQAQQDQALEEQAQEEAQEEAQQEAQQEQVEEETQEQVEQEHEKEEREQEIPKENDTVERDEDTRNESPRKDEIIPEKDVPNSSSEDEERKAQSDSNSIDEAQMKIRSSIRESSRTNRRKHRTKYREDSYSDTPESEDDPSLERETKQPETPEDEEEEPLSRDKDFHRDRSRSKSVEPIDTSLLNSGQRDHQIDEEIEKNQNTASESPLNVTSDAISSSQKSSKINLKRTFGTRSSVDEVKSEESSIAAPVETNEVKPNHTSEKPEEKRMPKRRRWGTTLSTDSSIEFSVSTDSLKALVPGAKPLSINEVRLSKDNEEEQSREKNREKHVPSDSNGEFIAREEPISSKHESPRKGDTKADNHMGSRRKISVVKDTPHSILPNSPFIKPTNILLIKNLVRPFTLPQIKELLSRTGTIKENGFWMDRIKSKCFVEYSNEDQAFETRQALHGISWPMSNPKKLHVEYAAIEDMDVARESSLDVTNSRKEDLSTDSWQHDWMREEKQPAGVKVMVVREWDLGKEDGQQHLLKEREKKEMEKKKRHRSHTPPTEIHLPPPARKFKKKEDEPPPAKLLDDLFRKTKATPCIYWLPLTNEQIVVKEEMRRQHMAEHARRLEEMRRAERNRDNRRRRSPRK